MVLHNFIMVIINKTLGFISFIYLTLFRKLHSNGIPTTMGSTPAKHLLHIEHSPRPSEAILARPAVAAAKTRWFSSSKTSFQLERQTAHCFLSKNLTSWFVSGLASTDCLICRADIGAGWVTSCES